jgi:hypothetical protein
MRLFLIAGGPSAADYDLPALRGRGVLIGVNDAGVLVDGVRVVVSMDRKWTENRWEAIRDRDAMFIVRESVWRRVDAQIEEGLLAHPGKLRVEPLPMDHTQAALSLEYDRLNGRNSGFCAFNWAVQQQPSEIYLFGFDMSQQGDKRHWHEPYPWSPKPKNHYGQWAADFDAAKQVCDRLGIPVFNCSATSRIEAFPRLKTMKAVLRRLEGK